MKLGSISLAFLCLTCYLLQFLAAVDIISQSESMTDSGVLTSSNGVFKLGFFSPANSSHRFVGIWDKNVDIMSIIWVANRNKPLNDTSGVVMISRDGNLVVLNGLKEIIWSSSVKHPASNTTALLLDTGNLVLLDKADGTSMWQSFQHPSDAFVEKMKLSTNTRTGESVRMTSWKTSSDPSAGDFSLGVHPLNVPEMFIWNKSRPYWRSGPWNGQIFIGVQFMRSVYLNAFNIEQDEEGTFYFNFILANDSFLLYYILNSIGSLEERVWSYDKKDWIKTLTPKTECDVYGKCGLFGICDPENVETICSCLRGFEPKNPEEWNRGNWSGGCIRTRKLQCQGLRNNTSEVGKEDVFLKLNKVKVPDFADRSSASQDNCKDECFKNCSCTAYAFDAGIGCMLWHGDLVDMRQFTKAAAGGIDLFVRVPSSELAGERKHIKKIIIVAVIIGITISSVCICFLWKWMAKLKDLRKQGKRVLFLDGQKAQSCFSSGNVAKPRELPLFKIDVLAIAINFFHLQNKLGEGGFGPVYMGILQNGQKIAVKRLSRASKQGLKEFMNEVLVISKLQHRNLVRLLGCCVEKEEKLLVYEYMPRNSLDVYVFDPKNQELLDWKARFKIIQGISRGLLYLHRDSRLKIIHRDLKASNILLDEELNPKISDFGMARIFGGNEDYAKTIRVVGTYGYMAPEYAMAGKFSEKSDVFSFGVLLLEIITGRRNTSFYNNEEPMTLLGFAWKLWNEDNVSALIDKVISDPCYHSEVLRCMHVGLLCVQESAKERPAISTVCSMLSSEIMDLPPKQPAFIGRLTATLMATTSPDNRKACSVNNLTVTIVEAGKQGF